MVQGNSNQTVVKGGINDYTLLYSSSPVKSKTGTLLFPLKQVIYMKKNGNKQIEVKPETYDRLMSIKKKDAETCTFNDAIEMLLDLSGIPLIQTYEPVRMPGFADK
jgi:hypothetical protein